MKIKKLLPTKLAAALNLRRLPVDRFIDREAKAVPAGCLVVDLGAGECNYKHLFGHTRYVGVDLGVGNAGWDYTKLDILGDLSRLPLRAETADVVVCTETLEHLSQPWLFAEEVSRVIKQGGRLLVTVPQMARLHQIPYDFFRYTRFGLASLFERQGFRVDRIDSEGGYFLFLGDTLKHLHGYLFRAAWLRWVFFPFYLISIFACGLFIPLVCRALDPYDKKQRFTMGYTCVFIKGAATPAAPPVAAGGS